MGEPIGSPAEGEPGFREALDGHLDRWVRAAVITPEQAEAIRGLEAQAPPPGRGRIPLVTEALGYVGALLAIAAGLVVLGRLDLSPRGWAGVLGAGAVIMLAAGGALRRSEEPAIERLTSVLWFLSVGLAGAAVTVFAIDLFDPLDEDEAARAVLLVGIVVTLYAFALFVARRGGLQQLALFGAVMTLAHGVLLLLADPDGPRFLLADAAVVWAVGLAWLLLGWRRVLAPAVLAYGLGALSVLVGPTIAVDRNRALALTVGLLSAAILLAASVGLRQVVLLGLGAVGLFGYLFAIIVVYLEDTLGLPLALFIAGVLLLAIAIAATRLRRFASPAAGGPRRGPSPPAPGTGPGGAAPASAPGR